MFNIGFYCREAVYQYILLYIYIYIYTLVANQVKNLKFASIINMVRKAPHKLILYIWVDMTYSNYFDDIRSPETCKNDEI